MVDQVKSPAGRGRGPEVGCGGHPAGAGAAVFRRLAWTCEEWALYCYESVPASLGERLGCDSREWSKVQLAIDRRLVLDELHERFGLEPEAIGLGCAGHAKGARPLALRQLRQHAVLWQSCECMMDQPVDELTSVVGEADSTKHIREQLRSLVTAVAAAAAGAA